MDEAVKVAVGIFSGFVTVAIISVIISRQSQTPQVIQATSTALANVVAAAVQPVHTSQSNANLSIPAFGGVQMPQRGF